MVKTFSISRVALAWRALLRLPTIREKSFRINSQPRAGASHDFAAAVFSYCTEMTIKTHSPFSRVRALATLAALCSALLVLPLSAQTGSSSTTDSSGGTGAGQISPGAGAGQRTPSNAAGQTGSTDNSASASGGASTGTSTSGDHTNAAHSNAHASGKSGGTKAKSNSSHTDKGTKKRHHATTEDDLNSGGVRSESTTTR